MANQPYSHSRHCVAYELLHSKYVCVFNSHVYVHVHVPPLPTNTSCILLDILHVVMTLLIAHREGLLLVAIVTRLGVWLPHPLASLHPSLYN